jgi:hypothetical protein
MARAKEREAIAAEGEAWEAARELDTTRAYASFILDFPRSSHRDEAERLLAAARTRENREAARKEREEDEREWREIGHLIRTGQVGSRCCEESGTRWCKFLKGDRFDLRPAYRKTGTPCQCVDPDQTQRGSFGVPQFSGKVCP